MRSGGLSDEQYQKRRRKRDKRLEQQYNADLRRLMDCEWGRRIAHHIVFVLGSANRPSVGEFELSIKDGIDAALHSWREDGKKAVGSAFLEDLESAAPMEVLLMQQEFLTKAVDDLQLNEQWDQAEKEE